MPDLQTVRYAFRGSISRWFERPAVSLLVALKFTPATATVVGLLIAVGAGYFASEGEFVIGGILVLVGSAFDLLDGGIARSTGRVSNRGAFMDSVFDRVAEVAVLTGLAVYFLSGTEANDTGVVLAFIAVAGSLMVSYVRARAEGLGVKGTAGFLTRPERVAIMVVALVAGYPMAALWILGVGTPLSAAWRFIDAWRAIGPE
ncbi:MAG: CDP-alcohol phosphatidyltransferase family protein [Dehalococcoidia bacterium]|nr:CDP-alcohol phosphatidyltransferase family protein [Dehalococcoidia bacterium]